MRISTIILITLTALICHLPQSESSKILITFAFSGRSQYIFGEAYLKALAARGHQVTVISPFEQKPVPNIRFITAPKIHERIDELMSKMHAPNYWEQQKAFSWMFNVVSECIFEDEGVQALMKSGETFDLFIAEVLQTEALYGFAQHFNATLMGFSTYGTDHIIDDLMGNVSPVSYNPLILSPRTQIMSFQERLVNHFEYWIEKLAHRLVHYPSMELQYAKYFPQAKKTLDEVVDSFSILLLGQHFSLSYSRPYLPNMIEVGGLQISHKRQPLPENIKEFIESSAEGVIYFSMGTNVKSKDLPSETRDTLLKVFGGLKQRVLWKFEDDKMPGRPANVFISKWFPQPDILAHPNVKLFITHGGLLSTTESIFFGKPVLGLPVLYDQFMNVQRATKVGFGLGLDLQNLKEAELAAAIQKLLTTPSYAEVSAAISRRYKDQPESALERAIWWTEYVLRHKGAQHMRAAARDLNYLQLRSVDTLAVLLGVPILLFVLLIALTCWVLRLACGKKPKRADKKKRH